jgi:hypothetical protein
MEAYLITLIGISMLVSVVGMVTPLKEKKYTRLVCTLCLLCVILKPLPEILDSELFSLFSLDGLSEENGSGEESFYNDIYNNTLRQASAQRISEGLEAMMIKDLGLPAGEFEVRVEIDDSEGYVKVNKTSVLIKEGAVARDPKRIVAYLEEMLGCKCEIVYI